MLPALLVIVLAACGDPPRTVSTAELDAGSERRDPDQARKRDASATGRLDASGDADASATADAASTDGGGAAARKPEGSVAPGERCSVSLECVAHASCDHAVDPDVCACDTGYQPDASACAPIDACATGNGGCDSLVTCTHAPGQQPSCGACPAGYGGAGGTGCLPRLVTLASSLGALSPAFDPRQPDYTLAIPLSSLAVELTATTPANLVIDGATVTSGQPWTSPPLSRGRNAVFLAATLPEHPSALYSVVIERGRNATLLKGNAYGANRRGGAALASGADTVVFGAPGANAWTYVFERNGASWTPDPGLRSSNYASDDGFGASVAISGDTVAVGAPFEDSASTGVGGNASSEGAASSGAAYVFVRGGGGATQQAYVKASNTQAGDELGSAVALSVDTLAVGAPGEDSDATGVGGTQSSDLAPDSGAVYVFARDAGLWAQQAYVKASDTSAQAHFGAAVALSLDTLVVGAPDGGAGAVYVFVRSGGVWAQQAKLTASDPDAGDGFGGSVAIDGERLVVGARGEDSAATGVDGQASDDGAADSGAAYVFVRSAGVWSLEAYLKPSNTGAGDGFGTSVGISGDNVCAGAPGEDSSATRAGGRELDEGMQGSGAAYAFARRSGAWVQDGYLKASNTGAGDAFGTAVTVFGDTIVAGAPLEDSDPTGQGDYYNDNGAAYVFE